MYRNGKNTMIECKLHLQYSALCQKPWVVLRHRGLDLVLTIIKSIVSTPSTCDLMMLKPLNVVMRLNVNEVTVVDCWFCLCYW